MDLHPELPVLTHHRLAGEGVLPMALGVDWMVQESRRLGLGLQLNRVENAQVLQGVSVPGTTNSIGLFGVEPSGR